MGAAPTAALDSVVDYRNKLISTLHGLQKGGVVIANQETGTAQAPGDPMQRSPSATAPAALAVGGIAALFVGACCVGPLLLAGVGLGGAWLGNLRYFEPYQPLFIAIALIALAFAWRRIYRPAAECKPGEVCAAPEARRGYKTAFWIVAALFGVMFGFPYIAPSFY